MKIAPKIGIKKMFSGKKVGVVAQFKDLFIIMNSIKRY
jgi:hypothetical protein